MVIREDILRINKSIPQEGIELVNHRTETSKKHLLGYTQDGKTKYALDCSIGAIHYKDDYSNLSEQWKDIDLTWENNKITKAPYELTLEGAKITVRDKKTGDVSTIELLSIKPAGLKWEIVPENTRVSFRHILPSDNVSFEARFRVTGNIPLNTRAFDDEGELELETTFVGDILTERLSKVVDKETKAARPAKGVIRIDPTLDLQVGVGANDGRRATGTSGFLSTGTSIWLGYDPNTAWLHEHGFFRWTGATLSGTVDVAYIQLYIMNLVLTPQLKVYAVDEDNPAAPTTAAEFDADSLTTAAVDWDSFTTEWVTSPSLITLFQELADSYTISNDALMVQVKNDHGVTGSEEDMQVTTYEGTTANAAKLHIEYTAGGGATFFLSVSGNISTITGTLVEKIKNILAGSISNVGVLLNKVQQILSGTLTNSGNIINKISQLLSGTIITISGSLNNTAKKILNGTISSIGNILNIIHNIIGGSLTSSGILINKINQIINGTITSSGNIINKISQLLSGIITTTGTLLDNIKISFSGSLSLTGNIVNKAQKILTGLIDNTTGNLTRVIKKNTNGEITPIGSLLKKIQKIFSGTIITSGDVLQFADFGAILRFHHDNYPTKTTFRFQVKMRATIGTIQARLVNEIGNIVVPNSTLSTASSDWVVLISPALTLEDNNSYKIQFGTTNTGAFRYAKIRAT